MQNNIGVLPTELLFFAIFILIIIVESTNPLYISITGSILAYFSFFLIKKSLLDIYNSNSTYIFIIILFSTLSITSLLFEKKGKMFTYAYFKVAKPIGYFATSIDKKLASKHIKNTLDFRKKLKNEIVFISINAFNITNKNISFNNSAIPQLWKTFFLDSLYI